MTNNFPFRRFLVVNTKTSLDLPLLRYAGMLASLAEDPEIVLAARASDRLMAQCIVGSRTALARPDSAAISFRVMLQPSLQLLFDTALECGTDLIVIPHPRDLEHARPLLRQLMFDAPCAVCLAPNGVPASLDRLLVRIEPTPRGHQLLSIAARIARAAGSEELVAIHSHFRFGLDWDPGSLETMRTQRQLEIYRFLARADLSGVNCTPVLEETPRQAETLLRNIIRSPADLAIIDPTVDRDPEWQWNRRASERMVMESPAPVLCVRLAQTGMMAELRERLFCEMEPLFN